MAFLKVLNVGQGDCLLLRPEYLCTYSGHLFYVDVGDGSVDISKEITSDKKVHIILTHHHKDHINGLKFFFNKFDQVEDITVPYCFNEIALIAQAILNLKGIKSAYSCDRYTELLNDITGNQTFLKSLQVNNRKKFKFIFACEGKKLCDHFKFLNPPLPFDEERNIDSISDEEFSELFNELFEEKFAKRIINYVSLVKYENGIAHSLSDLFLDRFSEESDNYEEITKQIKAGCKLVVNYFINNRELLLDFNAAPNKIKMQKIYSQYEQLCHDVCIVMKAEYGGRSFLLTGDASKKVFNRLINKNENISAYYFKVSHHGSKRNLDRRILSEIDPDVAIISHGNKRFSRAKDPHPNKEVLNMLRNDGVDILVTNDVIKNNKVCLTKRNYNDKFLEIE